MQLDKVGSEKRRIRVRKAPRGRWPQLYGVAPSHEGHCADGLSAIGVSWRRICVGNAASRDFCAHLSSCGFYVRAANRKGESFGILEHSETDPKRSWVTQPGCVTQCGSNGRTPPTGSRPPKEAEEEYPLRLLWLLLEALRGNWAAIDRCAGRLSKQKDGGFARSSSYEERAL